jgi:quinol-cytochrome oxidoreductase complex cytochrome b subunit
MSEVETAPRPPRSSGILGWVDERIGLAELSYPVPAHANGVLYTLGGITLFGVLVLVVTGIYLTQFYHGDPTQARESLAYIITTATLGDFVRSVHFWTANLVMITLLLHALRVFVTGSYRPPRELNWIVGVGLLGILFGLTFTGTVLKWDQEAWEALQHNEEMGRLLGGVGVWFTPEFTTATPILQRLYIAHVAILPLLLFVVVAAHLFLIKHHGVSSLPGRESRRPGGPTDTEQAIEAEGSVPFTTHVLHIAGWGLLLTAVAGLLSLLFSAPLGEVIDPGEEKTKPLWMFLPLYPFEDWFGIRALLWLPIGTLVGLAAVPFVDRFSSSSMRRRWVLIAAALFLLAAIVVLAVSAQISTPAQHIPGAE